MSKFTISSVQFAKALEQVVPVVPSNALVSSASCVLLVGRGSVVGTGAMLHLICTNLETRLMSNVAFDCDENFSLCIDARLLLTTIKSFADAPIAGSIADAVMSLKVGKSSYRLVGEPADGFVQVKKVAADAKRLSLPASVLHRALAATLSTANTTTNVASAFTNGILVERNAQHECLVSTCLTRLAAYTIDANDEEIRRAANRDTDELRALIPRSACAYLQKLLDPKDNAEVTLLFEADTVRLSDNRWHTRLMDIKFPEYRPIFPSVYEQELTVEHDELLGAIRRLSPYTDQNDVVVMHIGFDGSIRLHADNFVVGHSGEELLMGHNIGDGCTIGFPASQMANMLGLWSGGTMHFGINGPQRGVIISQEGDTPSSGLACMIAPSMILSSEHSYA